MSIDAGIATDKTQHSFMIKTLSKGGIEGTYLNITKTIYGKPTASIVLNRQKLQAFPLRLGTKQGCPLLPLLFSIVLTSNLTRRNKRHRNWKARSKTIKPLLADDMIL